MGQENTIMNIHISGLDIKNKNNYESQKKILNILFPKTDKKRSDSNLTVKYCEKPKWNAFIYSDRNTNNFPLIIKTIEKHIKMNDGNKDKKDKKRLDEKLGTKNHIVLHFVCDANSDNMLCEEFTKDETIDSLEPNFPLIIFVFKDIERNNLDYKDNFFDFSYIKCINLSSINLLLLEKNKNEKENKTSYEDLVALYLKSLLYNNYDSYFTERGHKLIDEIDPLSNKPMVGIYLPILCIGSCGAGKSTFINILNGSRISRASPSQESVTTKSAKYDVKIPGETNDEIQMDNEDLKQEAFIRFIDTPGFDSEKDIDIVMKEIQKIFKEFKEGKERIPVILYFINPSGRNISSEKRKKDKIIKIFELLNKNNGKIIFVVTHLNKKERWRSQNSFINLLKENGLEKLIETDKSNIIKCQLVGENAYGIKEIFKKIYIYCNLIEDNNFKQTEEVYTQTLIDEIKKRPNFDDKLKYIKSKTKLFNEFQSKEDILTYGRIKSLVLISSMTLLGAAAGLIPIPFADIIVIINIIGTTIVSIGRFYGYILKNISEKDIVSIIKGKLYDDNNNNDETFHDFKFLLTFIGQLLTKSIATIFLLNVDDIVKSVWGIGTIVGMAIGSICDTGIVMYYSHNAKNYFESKCRADDGTIFFCTRCSEYEVIFRKFKQFEKFDLIYPVQ